MFERKKRLVSILMITIIGLFNVLGCSLNEAGSLQPQKESSVEKSKSTISVSGTSQVQATPDRAIIRLGVEIQAESAEEAFAQNSTQMQSLLDALEAAGIASENIQTQSVRLTPRYDFDHEDETRTLVGYTAANVVRVESDQLDSLGVLLDKAVGAGATTIESVRFTVSDQKVFIGQARQAAVEDARYKAEQLAGLTGAELGPVLQIRESSDVPGPVYREAEALEEEGATPIEPGSETVQISVQITWTLITSE